MWEAKLYAACQKLRVQEEWFYNPKHRLVWNAVSELASRGKAFDLPALAAELTMTGKMEDVGNTYLNTLIDKSATQKFNTETHVEYLRTQWKSRTATVIAQEALGKLGLGSDPDDVLTEMASKAAKITSSAAPDTQNYLDQFVTECKQMKETGQVGYQPTLTPVGELISCYQVPDHIVIGGYSSAGKTSLLMDEFVYGNAKKGVPCAIYELDMTEKDLRKRLASRVCNVPFVKFYKRDWKDYELIKMVDAWKEVDAMPIYINDNASANIDEICSWGMAMAIQKGVKIFAVDFLQQINRTSAECKQDMRLVVGDWSTRIKALGKRFGMITVILSQLARPPAKKDETIGPHPRKESLKETGSIENNADIVMIPAFAPGRPIDDYSYKNRVWDMDLVIDKQRNGPTGIVSVCFNPSCFTFMSRVAGEELRTHFDTENQ